MANPFQRLRAKAGDGQKSIDWYMRNVKNLVGARLSQNTVMKSDIGELKTNIEIGSMYLYFYDPKLKNELPFYDTFHWCYPLEQQQEGFMESIYTF